MVLRLVFVFFFLGLVCQAQTTLISGVVKSGTQYIPFAQIGVSALGKGTITDKFGHFSIENIPIGKHRVLISALGFKKKLLSIELHEAQSNLFIEISLEALHTQLDEVVVTGSLKEVSRADSPVPIEVFQSSFFESNREPSLMESMRGINGVRPQINCNVCNTADIRINGLDGPYTMILVDGMPIVSGLSTIYGLNGIPQSLIERVEIIKGPASTIYGSEAVGGVINIITKSPESIPLLSLDAFGTTWSEFNFDMAFAKRVGKRLHSVLGVNYFNFQNPIDKNGDGFTDVTLQNRVSIFNKWTMKRKSEKQFSLALRYVYEDRWGGQMGWTPAFRGGNEIYAESIFTNRFELFGAYQLDTRPNLTLQFSGNAHHQNSAYGEMIYLADQYVGFTQLVWNDTRLKSQDFTAGLSYRYIWYDDNTAATARNINNETQGTSLPGMFVQDEWTINNQNKVLIGSRLDYHDIHGFILAPRFNYKWTAADKMKIFRLSFGNGFRVANIVAEDHAALTGSRDLIFEEELNPETSWNINANYVINKRFKNDVYIGVDASAFYSHFENRIIPDYETNADEIRYANLEGYAQSIGVSLSVNATLPVGLTAELGATIMDVSSKEHGAKERQMFSERFAGNWRIGMFVARWNLTFDYLGTLYGPMRMPLLSDLDQRAEYSPWWGLHNVQATKVFSEQFSIYGGVKNLFDYVMPDNAIARPFDPFDKDVVFDQSGSAIATPENPQALTFDPSYAYAPNQGIRFFVGIRYHID